MVLQQKSHHVTRSPLLLFLASRCSPKLLSRAFAWPFLACPLCPFLQTRPLPLYCLFNRIESLSSSIGLVLPALSVQCHMLFLLLTSFFLCYSSCGPGLMGLVGFLCPGCDGEICPVAAHRAYATPLSRGTNAAWLPSWAPWRNTCIKLLNACFGRTSSQL